MSSRSASRNSFSAAGQDAGLLRILLTNGRTPVSLDLARQFRLAGHIVFCVDPMSTHVCTFTRAVKQSARVPAPHDNPQGYVRAVKELVMRWKIDMIVPIDEEVFCLAASDEFEILTRLFASSVDILVRLHDQYEFAEYAKQLGLLVPQSFLCESADDLTALSLDQFPNGIALRPCLGREHAGLRHLKPGETIPKDLDFSEDNRYMAQDWLEGDEYRSYSVVRDGHVEATGCYPVTQTHDDNKGELLQQKFHPGVYEYIQHFLANVPSFSGQIAFDFIETANGLYAIGCSVRATAGLHLWSNTPWLAKAITGTLPKDNIERPIRPPKRLYGHESRYRVMPRMLMWKDEDVSFRAWLKHMRRMVFTRDVTWDWRDPMPIVAQPLLLTAYYRMCHKSGWQLPHFFHEQLAWEPKRHELEGLRGMFAEKDSVGADSGVELRAAESW
ncbi:hypothetical protein CERZMDRAFT_47361 [Cercospora zeae-maydis SCOH1-5]|uniref:ATP-grasp domain-containing protein n=1 Tax=Cercospora zeae-maydis SCOH1-5 TaxID=717836 RepID=A0A6A6F653_9PEZI|nr:hypothetical protein CERZMDRAFT_47361 [Cercospora zeae-maydis SCOH1-5]